MNIVAPETAPTILLADAQILSRHAIADYLRSRGYTVLEAANLDEAQIIIGSYALNIQLVLCDVTSSGENGIPELIQCADNNHLLLNLRFLAGFEAVARAAVGLSKSGDTKKDNKDLDLLVSYIRYAKAQLSYRLSH